MGIYERYGKRPLDFILSFLAIIVFSPAMVIVAILVRVKLGSPVLFKHKRPGKDEKIFTLYKFRTMLDTVDEKGKWLPDRERLTDFGRILRSSSLDELPELFNILKGDMSIVGPRPLVVLYLPYYNDEQRRRRGILPGLTGLAQVNGRNAIMWEERFAYDLEYVDNITFLGDMRVLFATIKIVLTRTDIGSRKESDSDSGVEDFHTYCIRKSSDLPR